MNYFERYESGERSLYKFNGELKKPNIWDNPIFNRLVSEHMEALNTYGYLPYLGGGSGRGVGFANSIPTRHQSIGRIIRDEVYTWS